jgi:hypothetical protein
MDVEPVPPARRRLRRGQRDTDPGAAAAVDESEERAPATAEVQHAPSRPDPDLVGHVLVLALLSLFETEREVAVVLGPAEVGQLTETEPEDTIDQRIGELEIRAVSHGRSGAMHAPFRTIRSCSLPGSRPGGWRRARGAGGRSLGRPGDLGCSSRRRRPCRDSRPSKPPRLGAVCRALRSTLRSSPPVGGREGSARRKQPRSRHAARLRGGWMALRRSSCCLLGTRPTSEDPTRAVASRTAGEVSVAMRRIRSGASGPSTGV